jgi:membrane protease YdiL (CAAX protease family)
MNNFPHWVDHILAFLLAIGIPVYTSLRNPSQFNGKVFSTQEKKQIYLSGSLSLFIMGAVIIITWLLFKRPHGDLGFTRPIQPEKWWWLVMLFILLYIADSFYSTHSAEMRQQSIERWKKRTPFLPTKNKELPLYFLMCFSAGVFEEVVYRGYLVTYCNYLFAGNAYAEFIAVLAPGAAFSIAHYYQGARAVMKIFVLSALFGFIFIYSGSLLVVMLLHMSVDAAGGLLSVKFLKDQSFIDVDIADEMNKPQEE